MSIRASPLSYVHIEAERLGNAEQRDNLIIAAVRDLRGPVPPETGSEGYRGLDVALDGSGQQVAVLLGQDEEGSFVGLRRH
ncbi:hypothetical protein [Roseomonas chloroacetimidivorans]|uniref:hypothetical protein n=1 Tax=Roseomonas chloroacetimidivorans TaxID=1766656 RepID=UPI003C781D5B